VEEIMPGKKKGRGLRLTARRKFQIYVETRGKEAPVGEILRRWNLALEQLREIEGIVEQGAIQALRVRSGHRGRPRDVSPEAFAQLQRELLEKEKALAELAVELTLVKKGLRSGSSTDGEPSMCPSKDGR
jgi:hypothetical protein